jgi:hypothetical protein
MAESRLFDLPSLKKEGLKAGESLSADPQIYDKLLLHAGKLVKRDKTTQNMVLLTGISAYTKNPINLFLKGESGIGKTYNVTQTLRYFPSEDVWFLGGLSPTALRRDYGLLVSKEGDEIDWDERPGKDASKEDKKRWREKLRHSRYIIDLQGKILVFLEAPHFETYNMLRPILSHDVWEISYRITDKSAKGVMRTSHVVVRGWPATIFCSTREKYVKDLATRGFTVTPETLPEKYRLANVLTGEKKALPWKFKEDFDFMLLQGYIGWLRNRLENMNVVIPYGRELGDVYPSAYARSMRDFNHLTALIEVLAQFHCMQRPVLVRQYERPIASVKEEGETVPEEEHTILAIREDYERVMDLWKDVEETTVTGLPGHILNFFHKAVEPLAEDPYRPSFSYEELTQKYNEAVTEKKSSDTIRKWVKHLCDVGWLDTEPDPTDKRKRLVKVIKNPKNNGEYWTPIFQDFFSLEAFNKWFDDAKKISEHNHFLLKENMLAEEPTSLDTIYKNGFRSDIFPSQSKQELNAKTEKEPQISGVQQSPIIPKPLTVQETLVLLKSSWKKGPQESFVKEAMQIGSLTDKEAQDLFTRLVDEGALAWFDEADQTVWSWTK